MFGRNKPVVFERHSFGRRPSRFRVPSWLIVLLLGVVAGAGGLWFLQEKYLPPRLSAAESNQIREKMETAERDRQKMAGELKQATEKLAAAEADRSKAQTESAAARANSEKLEKQLSQFVLALPPDPRGGPIGIRAASFVPNGQQLEYHVILTRVRKGDDSFRGTVQMIVSGLRKGRYEHVPLAPVSVALESYQHMTGSLAMPEGMAAKEVTIRVLRGGPGGEQQAIRVYKI